MFFNFIWTISKGLKVKIILISGKARSGKDYLSQLLKERLEKDGLKVFKTAFADKLKEYLCILFNLSLEELNNLKNSEVPFTKNGLTMRNLLQKFGTDIFTNKIDKFFWIKETAKEIIDKNPDVVIISDLRFKDEIQINKFVCASQIAVRIISEDSIQSSSHISENDLNDYTFDYYFKNDYSRTTETIEKLYNLLKDLQWQNV